MTYPDINISWSSLRVFEECAQRAKLSRERKRHVTRNLRGFFHGNVADAVMREWYRLDSAQRAVTPMSSFVEGVVTAEEERIKERNDGILKWKSPTDRAELTEFVEELCTRLQVILADVAGDNEVTLAKRFSVPIKLPDPGGGRSVVNLNGELDMLVYSPDGYSIWDLKATKDDYYWRKTIGQLTFYDIAMWAEHKAYALRTGLLQPMCKQQVLEVNISDDTRRDLLVRINRMATSMWNDLYPLAEDAAACRFCDCRHACPKFDPGRRGRVSLGTPKRKDT